MKLHKKLLFNVDGDDDLNNRHIINGNSTNILNLNTVKYNWARNLYRKMQEQFWLPYKVDLTSDAINYNQLTEGEREAYKGTLSFLIFLDSIQTHNVPRIADYITAPEITLCLTVHAYQEAVHTESYQYAIESIIPSEDRNNIYDYWRKNKNLLKRNTLIAEVFQNFSDNPNYENFYKTLIANYILESIYFYNGFHLFYNLSARNLMGGTADLIRYIQRDEGTHIVLFQRIIEEVIKLKPWNKFEDTLYKMMDEAVQEEITWSTHIFGNNILGINPNSIEIYTKHLANRRLVSLGYKKLYTDSKYEKNPYKHLEKMADMHGEGEVKSNFFESSTTSYNIATAVDGWDTF